MGEFASQDAVRHDSEHEIDKKVDPEQIEVGSPVDRKPSFARKTKRHCMRWWWIYLITFCASFLIIALCVVYVALPKIVQNGVNESSIEFTELDFLNPTPSSITVTQRAILYSPGTYTPTLDAFNASIYLVTNGVVAAEPMTYIQMPSIHVSHPQGNVSIKNQVVPIANIDQLTDFTIAALGNENVTTAIVGSTNVHEGSLPVVRVNYNSQTTYKGLNGLQGFNVTNLKVNLAAAPGTPNLSGNAIIPNPSVMTIAMGNVTFSVSTKAKGVVGNNTILDMTLVPGSNTLKLTGTLDQNLVLASLNSSGFVDLIIAGQSAIYNGQHLTYYEKALQSNQVTLTMNILQVLGNSNSTGTL